MTEDTPHCSEICYCLNLADFLLCLFLSAAPVKTSSSAHRLQLRTPLTSPTAERRRRRGRSQTAASGEHKDVMEKRVTAGGTPEHLSS